VDGILLGRGDDLLLYPIVDRAVPAHRIIASTPDKILNSPFYGAHEPCPCAHLCYQVRSHHRLYTPILIPDAPSASAATNPRLSAMPPEARYGVLSSCAARASCGTSVYQFYRPTKTFSVNIPTPAPEHPPRQDAQHLS
jgi:hypothetical protein